MALSIKDADRSQAIRRIRFVNQRLHIKTTAGCHMSEAAITVSDRAARRIAQIVAGDPATPMFRVSVEGGGCSGFQYKFDLVAESAADDLVIEKGGARVLVDPVSLGLLSGSEIDFVEDLMGATFKITNPNATASCGCGTSFAI
jgi:iron-sulfur cluster assembly accessory protein